MARRNAWARDRPRGPRSPRIDRTPAERAFEIVVARGLARAGVRRAARRPAPRAAILGACSASEQCHTIDDVLARREGHGLGLVAVLRDRQEHVLEREVG